MVLFLGYLQKMTYLYGKFLYLIEEIGARLIDQL